MTEPATMTDAALADEWEAALAEQSAERTAGRTIEKITGHNPQEYPQAEMETFRQTPSPRSGDAVNLDAVLDVPVTLSVVIGKTKLSIRNLLQLNQGSVVELDRLAGEPLDVLINGTLVAHGEVVVINEKFGIRLTDVVSAQERVRKLQ